LINGSLDTTENSDAFTATSGLIVSGSLTADEFFAEQEIL